jgi:hypothetical protein
MNILTQRKVQIASVVLATALLSACDDDERIVEVEVPVETIVEVPAPVPNPVPFSYSVTVTNLTHAQPLSPVAVILHESGYLWQIGSVASVDLEVMAEGGDNSRLLNLPVAQASVSTAAPLGPGATDTLMVSANDLENGMISIATMLVNTNDAFTGLNAWDLTQLEVGETYTTSVGSYDAGTEANTEAAGTIPGPVDGGEGFSPTRDDVGFVARHPGVVGSDDGLSNSVLSSVYKFDNPTMRIAIMRIE